jgi:hypothetical protein
MRGDFILDRINIIFMNHKKTNTKKRLFIFAMAFLLCGGVSLKESSSVQAATGTWACTDSETAAAVGVSEGSTCTVGQGLDPGVDLGSCVCQSYKWFCDNAVTNNYMCDEDPGGNLCDSAQEGSTISGTCQHCVENPEQCSMVGGADWTCTCHFTRTPSPDDPLPVEPEPEPEPAFIVCPSSTTLQVGGQQQFQARYWDEFDGSPSCSSRGYSAVTGSARWDDTDRRNNDVIDVTQDGLVTAVSRGSSSIEASYGGYTATAGIRVTEPKLLVCPSDIDISIGESAQLEARYWSDRSGSVSCSTGSYSTVTDSADWSSSNTSILTVTDDEDTSFWCRVFGINCNNDKGRIAGISDGIAQAIAQYNGLTAQSDITVGTPNVAPTTPVFSGDPSSPLPLSGGNVSADYTASGSTDPDGDPIQYQIDRNGNGTFDAGELESAFSADYGTHTLTDSKTYTSVGNDYLINARACDDKGLCSDWKLLEVDVNETPSPTLSITIKKDDCSGESSQITFSPSGGDAQEQTIVACDEDVPVDADWSINNLVGDCAMSLSSTTGTSNVVTLSTVPDSSCTKKIIAKRSNDITVSDDITAGIQIDDPEDPTPIEVEGFRWKEVAP